MKKIKSFFKGVKKEGKAVRWPSGSSLVSYSIITILLLVFFGLFFGLSDLVSAGLTKFFTWLGGLF